MFWFGSQTPGVANCIAHGGIWGVEDTSRHHMVRRSVLVILYYNIKFRERAADIGAPCLRIRNIEAGRKATE